MRGTQRDFPATRPQVSFRALAGACPAPFCTAGPLGPPWSEGILVVPAGSPRRAVAVLGRVIPPEGHTKVRPRAALCASSLARVPRH